MAIASIARAGSSAAKHGTSRVVRQEPDGRITTLGSHYGGLELNSSNDVVGDSSGCLYFTNSPYCRRHGEGALFGVGIPREEQQPVRGVYRLDPRDGSIIRIVEDFEEPNGLSLAEDDAVLFVNDTAKGHIRRFDVREDGVSGGEIWAVLQSDEPGVPDGMKGDAEGNLFCTGPGGLHVLAPNGQMLGVIRVPEVAGNFNWGDADKRTPTSAPPRRSIVAEPSFRAGWRLAPSLARCLVRLLGSLDVAGRAAKCVRLMVGR